jgi:hypothetical protein
MHDHRQFVMTFQGSLMPLSHKNQKDNFMAHLLLSAGSLSLPDVPSSPENLFSHFTTLRQALLSSETSVKLVNQWCDILEDCITLQQRCENPESHVHSLLDKIPVMIPV